MTNLDEYEQTIEAWRNEYISARNSTKGWEILEKLAKFQVEAEQQMETEDAPGEFDDFSTSKLITLIMGDIDTTDLLVSHQILLLEFLPSAHPNILRHVARVIRQKEGAVEILKTSALAVGIAFARRVTEADATEEIARLLAVLVDNQSICDELKAQLAEAKEGSTERSRIYSIATARAKVSPDPSCLQWLYSEILKSIQNTGDVLAQLDALDTLVDVALTGKENAKALVDNGIVKEIYKLMEWSRESPDSGDIYFYGTRFLCYMARSYPQVIQQFPDFVRRLMLEVRMFDQLSTTSRLGVFDHFASLCFSTEAKLTLEEIFKGSKDLENTLGAAGAACTMGTMEMKCRTLQAITLVFQNASSSMASEWYERLGGKALTHMCVGSVKKPFPEQKTAIYDFWQQLFEYPDVVKQFVDYQGFIDWALDEKSESQPEEELRKRQLIHRVIWLSDDSKTSEIVKIDAETVGKLKKYLQPAAAPAPRVEEMAL